MQGCPTMLSTWMHSIDVQSHSRWFWWTADCLSPTMPIVKTMAQIKWEMEKCSKFPRLPFPIPCNEIWVELNRGSDRKTNGISWMEWKDAKMIKNYSITFVEGILFWLVFSCFPFCFWMKILNGFDFCAVFSFEANEFFRVNWLEWAVEGDDSTLKDSSRSIDWSH